MKNRIFNLSYFLVYLILANPLNANSPTNDILTNSIEDTSKILENTLADDYLALSTLYASRAEDYLILGSNENALSDFTLAYQYGLNSSDKIKGTPAIFRSLFGLFLTYARAENLQGVEEIGKELREIVDSYSCNDCQHHLENIDRQIKGYTPGKNQTQNLIKDSPLPPNFKQAKKGEDYPILGPTEVPIYECLDRVKITADLAYALIEAVDKVAIRLAAKPIIDYLIDSCNRCCRAGGLWKACLQPLVNKWHAWKVFGIPNDPAWD